MKMTKEKKQDVSADSEIVKVEPVETERTKGHVLDVSSGKLAIELPAGYIQDGDVHTTAIVREMSGHEEDLLAGKGSLVVRLNAIIGSCLENLGPYNDKATMMRAANNLTAQDRMAILLAIRRASLGDFYDVKVSCPECKVEQRKQLDLKEIEIIPMPDRMKRERVDELPSGTEVKWHVINSKDEEWLTTQRQKKDDKLTLGLLARVDAVGDMKLDREKAYRKAITALKNLSMRDRAALRNMFEREEGSIDTEVEFECDECMHVWQGQLDVGQSTFFFPVQI